MSGSYMLDIEDLHVKIGEREVLHDINLHIGEGESHVLMGPNGSGKTTLLRTIMGFSGLNITEGRIFFKGEDITHIPIHKRAELGMGMLFQRPPTIAGLKLGKLLAVTSGEDAKKVEEYSRYLNMDAFLERSINLGFSGGEIKRSEVLQLMIQSPDFVMLDEPESGVDLENISLIGNAIAKLLEKDVHIVNRKKSGLVITHTGYILDYLDADFGHVMCDGVFRCHGNPREILKVIKTSGYKECLACQKI
jgi:Fe-S cluster assembly ATP-binding protein